VFGLGVSVSAVFSLAATSTPGAAHADKIAVVDIQRAILESTEGKAAIGNLKAEADRKQKEFDAKKEELRKLDEELAKQASILKPDALQKKQQELQTKVQQAQQTAMRMQQELQEKEMKTTGPIQEKVLRAIAQIADREKFSMVLRSEVVLWPQQNENDITNEVIRKTNAMKSGPATPAPAATGTGTPGAK
jgi:outer membrane protein